MFNLNWHRIPSPPSRPDIENSGSESGDVAAAEADEVLRRSGHFPEMLVSNGGAGGESAVKSTRPAVISASATSSSTQPLQPVQQTMDPFRQGEVGRGNSASNSKPDFGQSGGRQATPKYSSFKAEKAAKPDKQFGKWESHTKGIGMKLLQGMGWKAGEGLGIARQGISRPIDVNVRRRGQALQDRGERTQQSKEDFGAHDSEEEEEAKFRDQLQQWRVGSVVEDGGRGRRPKYVFKTADEVAQAAAGATPIVGAMANVKVIDMTGRTTRVTTGYDNLGRSAAASGSSVSLVPADVPMPELQHNIGLLVDFAAADIQSVSSKLEYEQKTVSGLVEERVRVKASLDRDTERIRRLGAVMGLVNQLQTLTHDTVKVAEADAGRCQRLLQQFQAEYPEEFQLYGLGSTVAVAVALPILRSRMALWRSPLDNPRHELAATSAWMALLAEADNDGVLDFSAERQQLFPPEFIDVRSCNHGQEFKCAFFSTYDCAFPS